MVEWLKINYIKALKTLMYKYGIYGSVISDLCQCRSDKRSAIRHSKIPCQLLSTSYVVEWPEMDGRNLRHLLAVY